MLPTRAWPDALGFHVACTLQCPKHADLSAQEDPDVFVMPYGNAAWLEWQLFIAKLRAEGHEVVFNGCYRCNVEAGGRRV